MKITWLSLDAGYETVEDQIRLMIKDDVKLSPYVVKTIVGLDADDIGFRTEGNAIARLRNFFLKKRDIIIRMGLNPYFDDILGEYPEKTYSALRDKLYKLIQGSRSGRIRIMLHDGNIPIAEIYGFVSKLEAPHFSKTPEAQITISCEDPMLLGVPSIIIPWNPDQPQDIVIQDNKSTAPHGFKFTIRFLANSTSFLIQNPGESDGFHVTRTNSFGFLNNDVVHGSSVYNDKYLYVVRGGVTTHLANMIIPGSVWPLIFPGGNEFHVGAEAAIRWHSVEHSFNYWGV